jgi:hypothetical protein
VGLQQLELLPGALVMDRYSCPKERRLHVGHAWRRRAPMIAQDLRIPRGDGIESREPIRDDISSGHSRSIKFALSRQATAHRCAKNGAGIRSTE